MDHQHESIALDAVKKLGPESDELMRLVSSTYLQLAEGTGYGLMSEMRGDIHC
jgi:hypothetical protein